MDKAYDAAPAEVAVVARAYTPPIRPLGEETREAAPGEWRHPARRWVVERTLAWLSRCCGLLARYEKKAANYLGSIKVAALLL